MISLVVRVASALILMCRLMGNLTFFYQVNNNGFAVFVLVETPNHSPSLRKY